MSTLITSFRGFFQSRSAVTGIPLPFRGTHQERMRCSPTRYGLIFIAMLAALLLGAVNHNNNLGYLLTFLLGSMAFVSIFHTCRNISGITPVSIKSRPVFSGQKAQFDLTVKPLSTFRQGVSFHFPEGDPTTVNLSGGSTQSVRISLETRHRGIFRPATLFISTVYPLGLFRAFRAVPVQASCLVYPRPLTGPFITVPGPDDKEDEGDAGGTGVEDFSGLEIYQPGDQLQHISWKTYSRGQGLYTKKFEGRRGRSMYFNPDTLPGRDFEVKLSRVCSMILRADAMRIPYGLQLRDRLLEPGLGEKHKQQLLRELALAERREK